MKKIKELLLRFFSKRRLIRWGIYLILLVILFLCRAPILRSIGNWLIDEDELEQADAIVMLGGNSFERGKLTFKFFKEGYSPLIVTSGKNCSNDLKAFGINMTEAQQSKKYLVDMGIDSSKIIALSKGTSTIEEANSIKEFSEKNGWNKIIIVTSKFHTYRVRKYFGKIFSNSKVKIIVRGCEPLKYKTNKWWHSEEGLLMVNNEYIKGFYYWWNY